MVISEATDDLWYPSKVGLGPPLDQLKPFEGEVLVVMVRLNGSLEFYVVCWCIAIFLYYKQKILWLNLVKLQN